MTHEELKKLIVSKTTNDKGQVEVPFELLKKFAEYNCLLVEENKEYLCFGKKIIGVYKHDNLPS